MKKYVLIVGGFNLPRNNASAIRAICLAKCLQMIGYFPIVAGLIASSKEHWCVYEGVICYNIGSMSKIAHDISFMYDIQKSYTADSFFAIIAYNFAGVSLHKLCQYARANHIKMISDVTEWYGWEFRERGIIGALERKFQTELRMRILNKSIGNLICTTNYIANYYNHCHTIVIPAIDDNSFVEDKQFDVFITKRPRHFFYAGSPGYRFRKDRINLAVKLFERLSRETEEGAFVFDIYGVTEEEYLSFFSKPDVRDGEVLFHGRIPREEVISILHTVDFYVLLRPNNKVCKVGFSTKSMESVSAGVPLIANDVNGDFSRYFTQGQALLCGAEDLEGYFSLLRKACFMPDNELLAMKESCIRHNPFKFSHFIEPLSSFMSELR